MLDDTCGLFMCILILRGTKVEIVSMENIELLKLELLNCFVTNER